MPVKVFLVEDHEIVRQGIKALLDGEPDIIVTGEAPNGIEMLKKLEGGQPDVLLMDMNMPEMSGVECTTEVKKRYPGVKVLILSMHDHESYLVDMIYAGADGYILKNSSREELLFAIRKVANDGVYISSEFALNMLAKHKRDTRKQASPPVMLSDREMDVLVLIAEGHTNTEIADKLFTSVRTIETRRKNLLDKTGTTNTATLIRYAVLNGLVS
jgi:DNA-binding NarL/FixJ family response regulator